MKTREEIIKKINYGERDKNNVNLRIIIHLLIDIRDLLKNDERGV